MIPIYRRDLFPRVLGPIVGPFLGPAFDAIQAPWLKLNVTTTDVGFYLIRSRIHWAMLYFGRLGHNLGFICIDSCTLPIGGSHWYIWLCSICAPIYNMPLMSHISVVNIRFNISFIQENVMRSYGVTAYLPCLGKVAGAQFRIL